MSEIIIKNKEQIAGIKKASKIAANTLVYLEQFVNAGVTTEELDQKAAEFIKEHGGIAACLNYPNPQKVNCPFPKSICTSLNDVVAHGIPSEKDILKDGDILNIDLTVCLDGYYGDTCKMYTVGEVSKEAAHVIKTAQKALMKGIEAVKPGVVIGKIGTACERVCRQNGCSSVYQFAGHGVGVEFHEAPIVYHINTNHQPPELKKVRMKEGMIFTIEPMVNLGSPQLKIDTEDGWTARTVDGELSAQFEHTILVTKKGAEILTLPTEGDQNGKN